MRFINSRRSPSMGAESTLEASVPYQAATPSDRPPVFLYQPLGKSALEQSKEIAVNGAALRSFSYEVCQAGKAPVFGMMPQKGNGPIKLQTSRRLSSGELITTSQDSQPTLQDIREGDYVVGKKDRPASQSQGRSSTHHCGTRASTPRTSHTYMTSPTSLATNTSQTWPHTPTIAEHSTSPDDVDQAGPALGLGLSQTDLKSQPRHSQDSLISYQNHTSHRVDLRESTNFQYRSPSDANATLKALRKAEFSRLVELYGSEIAARNLAQLDRDHLRSPSNLQTFPSPLYSPVILEPLPPPPTEKVEADLKRNSQGSSTSESYLGTCSGSCSPKRASFVSSCADSSIATGQTSLEDEPITTREDIRSMIEKMRSNYLTALESQIPQMTKPKHKKRSRKQKLAPSPVLGASQQPRAHPSPVFGRQTWHAPVPDTGAPKRRINSQPAGRLSPIQASPSKDIENESGLKRADSSTLGVLMADLTREQIRSRRSTKSRSSRQHVQNELRPQTPRAQAQEHKDSWLTLDSDSAEEPYVQSPHPVAVVEAQPVIVSHRPAYEAGPAVPSSQIDDFDSLFADDLWSSTSPLSVTSIKAHPSGEMATIQRQNAIDLMSTPMKRPSRVPLIPESPEYTHLARGNATENNFI